MSNSGLEAVMLAHRAALLRFLRARSGDSDAEDLLQELWLKLQSAAPTGPIAEPLSYLYRAADNLVHDRRRAARRREQRETDWAGLLPGLPPAAPAPSAERVLLARDELARMEAALTALGERTATILRRFRLEGQSQKAIAGQLGISLSAVEKHLQRAYRGLAAARAGATGAAIVDPRRHGPEIMTDAAS